MTRLSLFSVTAVSVMPISGQPTIVMEGETFNLSVSIDAAPTLSDFVVVIRNNTPGMPIHLHTGADLGMFVVRRVWTPPPGPF